jgi:polyisoprenoid-binding protein YceI
MKTLQLKIKWLVLSVFLTGLMITIAAFSGKQTFEIQKPTSSMTVEGTSSLHDWKVQMKDFRGDLTAVRDKGNMKIESVTFRGKTKSMASDNSIMDSKTHDALKADKCPEIMYSIKSSRDVQIKDNKFSGLITGDLSIAGKTRTEAIQFTGSMISDNKMQIRGSKKLKMTDYGIDPPTAMLGTLKTGNEVTVTFTLILVIK